MKPALIRITLGDNNTVHYWAMMPNSEDYERTPLPTHEALHWITGGRVPVELACRDPKDKQPHNYEILLDLPNGNTTTSINLTRI